jgi:hypothetical protein
MNFSNTDLRLIYNRTSGRCHLCRKKLAFTNYGLINARAAWEVDHSRARGLGGTDRLSNLRAACISCNRAKGMGATRTFRARFGYSSAPLSATARRTAKRWNAVVGAILGAVPGAVFGPIGVAIGAAVGAKLAHDEDPDPG